MFPSFLKTIDSILSNYVGNLSSGSLLIRRVYVWMEFVVWKIRKPPGEFWTGSISHKFPYICLGIYKPCLGAQFFAVGLLRQVRLQYKEFCSSHVLSNFCFLVRAFCISSLTWYLRLSQNHIFSGLGSKLHRHVAPLSSTGMVPHTPLLPSRNVLRPCLTWAQIGVLWLCPPQFPRGGDIPRKEALPDSTNHSVLWIDSWLERGEPGFEVFKTGFEW